MEAIKGAKYPYMQSLLHSKERIRIITSSIGMPELEEFLI